MIKNPGIRLVKRIVLGKNKPPSLLRFLCWFTILWSTLCALFMFGIGGYELITKTETNSIDLIKNFTTKFYFYYGSLHIISIGSAILMYRLKKIGVYLYTLSNIGMIVLPYFYLGEKTNYLLVGITLILIGLFLSQWKKFN